MTLWINMLGIVGSVAFAISGAPAAYAAYKARKCTYSRPFLWLWLIGELSCLGYTAGIGAYVMWINYVPNMLCLLVLFTYNTAESA